MAILIIGCGYRGKKLAQALRAQDQRVKGLTRSEAHAAEFKALGIEPVVGDVTQPDSLKNIGADVTAVYHLMGSMQGSDEQLQKLHVDGTRNIIAALRGAKLIRYIYESSTAVYGQTSGETVDESAPLEPSSKMGKLRVQAESILLHEHRETGLPLVILRPASLYRPEGVINKKIRDGAYVLTTDPGKLMNHIYIEDYIAILAAALTRGKPGGAYNVVDDEPKPYAAYINRIADLMSAPHPRVEWQPPAGGCAELISASNKRVSNAKLKRDFALALKFPTYREGLAESARLDWREF